MRLGKDVLEADLYQVLGVLPDATESEIRVAYRRQVRTSHPDLHQEDPDAVPRMKKLNVAARVLLDPSLRRAYDRVPRGPQAPRADVKPARPRFWFERRELCFDDDWAPVPPPERPDPGLRFGGFFRELRGRDGHFSLQVQATIDSMTTRQQIALAAALCALALALIVSAAPPGLIGDSVQPTTIDVHSVYP